MTPALPRNASALLPMWLQTMDIFRIWLWTVDSTVYKVEPYKEYHARLDVRLVSSPIYAHSADVTATRQSAVGV